MLKSVSETNQLFEIRVKFHCPKLHLEISINNMISIYSVSLFFHQFLWKTWLIYAYSKLRWNGMLIKLGDLTHKRWKVLVARKHVAQIFFYRVMTRWYSRNKMLLCLCHYERGKFFAQEKVFHLSSFLSDSDWKYDKWLFPGEYLV